MPPAPLPQNETARLRALLDLAVLDSAPEYTFDAIVKSVARSLNVPIALVSLVDEARQWFKARVGLDATETSREVAFCAHAILEPRPLVVPDSTTDPRFADNPLVSGAPHVRSYLGVPLTDDAGHAFGTLCAIDHVPRAWTAAEIDQVENLASLASELLAQRRALLEAERQKQALVDISQELVRGKKLFEEVSQAANIGGWSLDLTTNTLTWTEQTRRIHEVGDDFQPDVETAIAFYASEVREALRDALEASISTGESYNLELPVTTAKGRAIWVRAIGKAECIDGRPIRLYGSFQDITAERARQMELKEALVRADRALADVSAYQAALDQHAIVAITDARGDIQFVNDRFCEISGYTREELMGQNHRLLNSSHHDRIFFVEMWRTIGKGLAWNGEICNKSKGGALYWVDTTIVPMLGPDGRPERYVSVRYDITERKAADQALRSTTQAIEEKSALVSGLTDAVPGALFQVFAPDCGKLIHTFISAGVERLFGSSAAEIHEDPGCLIRKLQADDRKKYIELAQQLNVQGGSFDFTYRYHHPSRGVIFVQTLATAVRVDGGAMWYAYSSDVTERKHAEAQLQEAVNSLTGFFDVSLDLLCFASIEGRFVRVNAAFEKVLGYRREELEGQDFLSLIHPDDLAASDEAMAQLGQGAQVLNFVNRYRCRDGSYRNLEWRSTPANGLIYAAARDITERLRHEAEIESARAAAEAANEAKSAFIANMSHEIRTPLNGVIGLAGALTKTQLDQSQHEMVTLIGASGETLERLVSDILDVSKIEAGKLDLHVQSFDLKDAVDTAAEVMRVRADDKGLGFEIIYGPEARGLFQGDVVRVRQIISNLASNAVKFTNTGGVKIFVDVADGEDERAELSLTVEDTGIGFDTETGGRLFSRFEQADSSITRTYGGTGLGLSICRALAEMMDGTVNASSIPGVGSRFTVVLPLQRTMPLVDYDRRAAVTNETAGDAHAAASVASEPRVLLAEDHPTNQRVVSLILAPLGVTLTIANNGREALETISSGTFDAVLMDMQMPVMDGLSAVRAIRAMEKSQGRPRTPIAMLSANAMAEHVDQSIAAGSDIHIPKPVTPDSLIKGLEMLLALNADTDASLEEVRVA
jgi:two-component system, sensor histidine kinase